MQDSSLGLVLGETQTSCHAHLYLAVADDVAIARETDPVIGSGANELLDREQPCAQFRNEQHILKSDTDVGTR